MRCETVENVDGLEKSAKKEFAQTRARKPRYRYPVRRSSQVCKSGKQRRAFENVRLLQVMLDRDVLLPGVLLLGLLSADILILYRLLPEVDTIEHFLFGFVLSQASARFAGFYGLDNRLRKLGLSAMVSNLTLRLAGFLLVGGLLWELIELLIFPSFGVPYNPFLALPLNLRNIDGALDVAAGTVGSLIAWHLEVSKEESTTDN